MEYKKLWISLGLVIVISFVVLLFFGNEIYHDQPPTPNKVVTTTGEVLFTGQNIKDGQNIWQSIGGKK